jgi:hypothetical protein
VWYPAALQAAASYIRDEWTAQGYSVQEQSYEVGGLRCANLEVAVAGDGGGPVIVIGAHYDSVRGSPGADDNASGVATLLELSRLFAGTADLRLRSVAFVLNLRWFAKLRQFAKAFRASTQFPDTADSVSCTELAEVTLGLAGAIRRFG